MKRKKIFYLVAIALTLAVGLTTTSCAVHKSCRNHPGIR